MTAHKPKPTIRPEHVEWFARYYKQHPAWGVFHVALADGNWNFGAADTQLRPGTGQDVDGVFVPARYDFARHEWPHDVRKAAEFFDKLTPSQRRRLGQKAEDLANTVTPLPRATARIVQVAKVDAAHGVVTLEAKR
jgi:hypothetical protein